MTVRICLDPPFKENYMWLIKKIVKKGDYLYAVVPEHPKANKHGYVLEHRVVLENSIGRLLLTNEIVHHIDGNKHNNNLSNLEVMSVAEHAKIHAKGRNTQELKCGYCGNSFTREVRKLNGKRNPMCSRKCNGLNNVRNLKYSYRAGH